MTDETTVTRDIHIFHGKKPAPGDAASVRKTITAADQGFFVGISGNLHPLYVDDLHAARMGYKSRLLFELVVSALATNALTEIGGAGYRMSSINLRFPNSALLNDTVSARAEIVETRGDTLLCRLVCETFPDGMVVAEGEAELSPGAAGDANV